MYFVPGRMSRYYGVDPRDIKVFTLDAGQAFVVRAYAHLPQSRKAKDSEHETTSTFEVSFTNTTAPQDSIPFTLFSGQLNKVTQHNLAVNQKAAMQPTFRYRRWLEGENQLILEGRTMPIANIESLLPPLRDPK
ncbi:hypothetical protein BGZ98_004818, partial [Dissophora globulifera]